LGKIGFSDKLCRKSVFFGGRLNGFGADGRTSAFSGRAAPENDHRDQDGHDQTGNNDPVFFIR